MVVERIQRQVKHWPTASAGDRAPGGGPETIGPGYRADGSGGKRRPAVLWVCGNRSYHLRRVSNPFDTGELPRAIREEYLAGMRAALRVLAAIGERLAAAGNDRQALETLQQETHKIHGSAGSFGFMDASRLAAGMEVTAKDWVAHSDDRAWGEGGGGGEDVDRGSFTRWFVARLAEMLGLHVSGPSGVRLDIPARPQSAAGDVPEVVFVEDDPALAELLAYGLRAHGYRYAAYRKGDEALRELLALNARGTHPLLLLDVDLPGLDGYSIFAALQKERPGTYRVVFTTVRGTEAEELRGREAGALDYLVKPISLRVALEKIKRWVGR